MNHEQINILLKLGKLRKRELDIEKIKSMIESAKMTSEVAREVRLNEKSATLVFREFYESIRQLGEAKWWLLGYEPCGVGSHVISLDILKDFDIKNKIKLNNLDRFKRIRHDANYQGFKVLASQAEEIIDFWDSCCPEIIRLSSKEINTKKH